MKIELMQVGDRLSLEMDPAGLDAVRAFIGQTYPDLTTRVAGIARRSTSPVQSFFSRTNGTTLTCSPRRRRETNY